MMCVAIRTWWVRIITRIDMALHPDDYGAHRGESIAEDGARREGGAWWI